MFGKFENDIVYAKNYKTSKDGILESYFNEIDELDPKSFMYFDKKVFNTIYDFAEYIKDFGSINITKIEYINENSDSFIFGNTKNGSFIIRILKRVEPLDCSKEYIYMTIEHNKVNVKEIQIPVNSFKQLKFKLGVIK